MAANRDTGKVIGINRKTASAAIDASTITYSATTANGSAQAGKAVALNGSNVAVLADDGDAVYGVLENVESDGLARIVTGGIVAVEGLTANVTVGQPFCGSATAGKIRDAVIGTDPVRGVIKDISNIDKVIVDLDAQA